MNKKGAIDYWKGAMVAGVKNSKGESAKTKREIASANAQARGAMKALDS